MGGIDAWQRAQQPVLTEQAVAAYKGPVSLRFTAANHNAAGINLVTAVAGAAWDNLHVMETSSFDLLYLESDPRTKQPSACLCLKPHDYQDYAGVSADRLITAPCLSLIELDAEIRRLHAELEEIRALAKRRFYKAESSAAGGGA
jgi:hypothetical protein